MVINMYNRAVPRVIVGTEAMVVIIKLSPTDTCCRFS